MRQNDNENSKRARIGKLCGLVGILCNMVLALSKIIIGKLVTSMSIMADGINNLSDAASSVVTLAGFKLAEKPADKEHPYGHARFEYLSGLTVAVMILVIGIELLKSSAGKIVNPKAVECSGIAVGILIISILVKGWMMYFNNKMGKKINSSTLIATSMDSRNDVITTMAVLLAVVIEYFTGYRIDGYMGIMVSLFIIVSGYKLAKETISPLLGEGAGSTLRKELIEYIDSNPMVLGCHDLMVHDYGPGKRYASIHVEIDKNIDNMVCHDVIDNIERECQKRFETHMVIHYDPVITDDEDIIKTKKLLLEVLDKRDEKLTIHDFRMMHHNGMIRLVFDMIIPEGLYGHEQELKEYIEEHLNALGDNIYQTDITFDIEEK